MPGTRDSYTATRAFTITAAEISRAAAGIKHQQEAVEVVLGGLPPFRVLLDRTPVGFGGTRLWLRCPACSRRAAQLHLVAPKLLCVRCAGITPPGRRRHRDRQWEAWGRAAHRLAQVRALLGRRYLRLARRGTLERLAERLEKKVCSGLLAVQRDFPTFSGMPCASAERVVEDENWGDLRTGLEC